MSEGNGIAQPPSGVGLDGLRDRGGGLPGLRAVGAGDADGVRRGPGDRADRLRRRAARRPGGPDGRAVRRPGRASCSTDALGDAGIDRRDAYVTNAVKHFRFTVKGKRRIHQTPGPGAPARLPAVAGGGVRRPQARGRGLPRARRRPRRSSRRPSGSPRTAGGCCPGTCRGCRRRPVVDEADDDEPDEAAPAQTWMLATTHPSAILRTPDEARAAAYDALVADLKVVAAALAPRGRPAGPHAPPAPRRRGTARTTARRARPPPSRPRRRRRRTPSPRSPTPRSPAPRRAGRPAAARRRRRR